MDYSFSTDRAHMDIDTIHEFLVDSYWAKGIPKDLLQQAIDNSFCFGMIHATKLVAFGRFVTDYATFAYLADVFVVPAHRGKGLSKTMMAEVLARPEIQGLRRMLLVTRDAHGLYEKFGFEQVTDSRRFMQQVDPDIYTRISSSA